MMFHILREAHPRLYHPADDPDYRFAPSKDAVRQRILKNVLADCEIFYSQRPWKRIPERSDSPHPYHQLYLTFYTGMHATALIEHYAFAWRLTGDDRWLKRAKSWMLAAAKWEHSDRVEEHFYTANRYMQAFALGLDLLGGELSASEEDCVTDCLIGLMKRWWPDVEANRHSPDGRHHAVVDNGHFGVAALHLLGKCSDAPAWVEAVIDRFRSGIMPHGCGRDGEPGDGPTFWPWENLWMLHFADALRNVTGVDLYQEFPKRLERPLKWFRYHLAAPEVIEDCLYYPANANLLSGSQLDACSPALLRLAQEAGDGDLRDTALKDPRLGRLYRFGMGVKGSTAECMIAYGPYVYCYYDLDFEPSRCRGSLPLSRKFTKAYYGETAFLRSSWDARSVIACISGYKGGGAHGFSNLHVQWEGQPVLKTISAEEAQPVACGSLPCVGGQNEVVALMGRLEAGDGFDRLDVRSVRTEHEYWLLHGEPSVLLVALRRRPRGVKALREDGTPFVRLNGRDCLQYERKPYFDPRAGELRMRFRLNAEIDGSRPQVLFNTGIGGVGEMGTRVNTFNLGLLKDGVLAFCVHSQRDTAVQVEAPPVVIRPGTWHDVAVRWGGFNRPGDRPFIEIALDGRRERCDDRAAFGELGLDSQKLKSRTTPRTFYIKSNTLLAFGGGIQMVDTGTRCDISHIDLKCPGRRRLALDFEDGLGGETGNGPLAWKLNPVDLKEMKRTRAVFGAGYRRVEVLSVYPDDIRFETEVVPFAPSGLAAASLKSFIPDAGKPSLRVLASTEGDMLILAFSDRRAKAKVVRNAEGFCVQTAGCRYVFGIKTRSKSILTLLRREAPTCVA